MFKLNYNKVAPNKSSCFSWFFPYYYAVILIHRCIYWIVIQFLWFPYLIISLNQMFYCYWIVSSLLQIQWADNLRGDAYCGHAVELKFIDFCLVEFRCWISLHQLCFKVIGLENFTFIYLLWMPCLSIDSN